MTRNFVKHYTIRIPKNKILELRFGQLIYNAICCGEKGIWLDKERIADILFNIENEELQTIIDNFIEEYKDAVIPSVKQNEKT